MRKLSMLIGLFMAGSLAMPALAFAHEGPGRYIAGATEAADFMGDARGISAFSTNDAKTSLVRVHGSITAVSTTSITVLADSKQDKHSTAVDGTSYTFTIDANTKVIRRFHGLSAVNELTVGDEVKVWANQLEAGTAKLIIDKSIWWMRLSGRVVELNTTDHTFRLLMPMRRHGHTVTFSGLIKTSSLTQYIKADGTAGAFTDLANNQNVRVRGVWNNIGYYLNARKVWILPSST